MHWVTIGVIILASLGLAALIARLIFGKSPQNKTAYVVVFFILFMVFKISAQKIILPKFSSKNNMVAVESAISDIPVYAAIKKHDPETHQKLIEILSEALAKGYNEQQGIAIVSSQMQKILSIKLPKSSDEAIISYANAMVNQMEVLHGYGGDLCYKKVIGERVDLKKYFSEADAYVMLNSIEPVIETYSNDRHVPTEEEALPFFLPIYDKLYEKYGDDTEMLENPLSSGVNKEKVCAMMLDMYTNILKLPTEQSAMVLRWNFSQ